MNGGRGAIRTDYWTPGKGEPAPDRQSMRTAPPEQAVDRMTADTQPPTMREAECPFCERVVLVYEDPPRCPLCACPLDAERMRPHAWPGEPTNTGGEV